MFDRFTLNNRLRLPKLNRACVTYAMLATLAVLVAISTLLLLAANSTGNSAVSDSNNNQKTDLSTLSLLPPPQSIEELVERADVIVIGKVGRIVNQGSFYGYDQGAGERQHRDASRQAALPITDYEIDVERVFLDDGTIASGQPLILRFIGTPKPAAERSKEAQSEYPMSYTGDRNLFFLSRNPDNKTYGLYYGPWSRLVIDGPVVTYSNGSRTPPAFADQTTPVDFLVQLEAVVLNKSK